MKEAPRLPVPTPLEKELLGDYAHDIVVFSHFEEYRKRKIVYERTLLPNADSGKEEEKKKVRRKNTK